MNVCNLTSSALEKYLEVYTANIYSKGKKRTGGNLLHLTPEPLGKGTIDFIVLRQVLRGFLVKHKEEEEEEEKERNSRRSDCMAEVSFKSGGVQ